MKLLKSEIKINVDKKELSELMKDAQGIKDVVNDLSSQKKSVVEYELLFAFCCEITQLKGTTNNFSIEVNDLNVNLDFERLKKIRSQFIKLDKIEKDIDFLTMGKLMDICML